MSTKPKFIIDCADHAGYIRLARGQKTILTRANKSSKRQEDYTQTEIGDILELTDNKTGDSVRVQVLSVKYFSSLSELFNESKIANETFNKSFATEQDLKNEYENNRPGYTKIIDQNGLVAWRIQLVL